jgi:hypothetical protein
VWPKSCLLHWWLWSHLKLELSISFCSTNWPQPLWFVCWMSKSDLRSRAKFDQFHGNCCYGLGPTWSCSIARAFTRHPLPPTKLKLCCSFGWDLIWSIILSCLGPISGFNKPASTLSISGRREVVEYQTQTWEVLKFEFSEQRTVCWRKAPA